MGLRRFVSDAVVRALTAETRGYQRRVPNHLERLKRYVRPGDVVLVEGRTCVAQIIKYLTQSSWSHSALYVGDRLVSGVHPRATHYWELFGDESRYMIIEADLSEGVSAVPISKYADHNLRLCRPYAISPEDLEVVLEDVTARLGQEYDSSHLLALARFLAPVYLLPRKWHRRALFSDRSRARSVICSSLLAHAFLKVRYPVLPLLSPSEELERKSGTFPYGRRFRSLHPRLVLPRDFDLSPYFSVVKFNQIEAGGFDYRSLEWEVALEDPDESPARSTASVCS